jgi:hypothetical protein
MAVWIDLGGDIDFILFSVGLSFLDFGLLFSLTSLQVLLRVALVIDILSGPISLRDDRCWLPTCPLTRCCRLHGTVLEQFLVHHA